MTLEQILLSGIGAVTSALCFVCRLLWAKSEQCERDRYYLRGEIERLKSDNGVAAGTLRAYELCPAKECPFHASVLVNRDR